MGLANGYRPSNEIKVKRPNREMIGSHSNTFLVIKLPTSIILRILSRSLFLAAVILVFPSIRLLLRGSSSSMYEPETIGSSSIDVNLVPMLLRDLAKEGLVNKVNRVLITSSNYEKLVNCLGLFDKDEFNLVLESDLGGKSMILDESFDVVLALGSRDSVFEDRVLKIGGLLVVKLSDDPSSAFQQLHTHKLVYVRRFNSTIVATKKTSSLGKSAKFVDKVLICDPSEAKKAELKNLEDPLLEPPPRSSGYLKEIKFLANLLGNISDNYSRRIFITDENENGDVLEWFHQNYPKKRHHFEGIKTGNISNWINRNAMEDDFIVVKAEAQSVEEMMREKMICLVDELFLECKVQSRGGWDENSGKKRAYWECLALFGKLREEGVAVHQWWD